MLLTGAHLASVVLTLLLQHAHDLSDRGWNCHYADHKVWNVLIFYVNMDFTTVWRNNWQEQHPQAQICIVFSGCWTLNQYEFQDYYTEYTKLINHTHPNVTWIDDF